eukprot:COSAG01_NODE_175_length_22996_cov_18.857892_3_plen_89_part_00
MRIVAVQPYLGTMYVIIRTAGSAAAVVVPYSRAERAIARPRRMNGVQRMIQKNRSHSTAICSTAICSTARTFELGCPLSLPVVHLYYM